MRKETNLKNNKKFHLLNKLLSSTIFFLFYPENKISDSNFVSKPKKKSCKTVSQNTFEREKRVSD